MENQDSCMWCAVGRSNVNKYWNVVKLQLTSKNDYQQFIDILTLITDTITLAPFAIPDVQIQDVLKSNGLTVTDECKNVEQSISIPIGDDMFWNISKNTGFQKVNKTFNYISTISGITLQGCEQTVNKSNCVF